MTKHVQNQSFKIFWHNIIYCILRNYWQGDRTVRFDLLCFPQNQIMSQYIVSLL